MDCLRIVIPMSGVMCNNRDFDRIIKSIHQTTLLGNDGVIVSIRLYSTYNQIQTVCIVVELGGIFKSDNERLLNNIKLKESFSFKGDTYSIWLTQCALSNTIILDNDHILYLGKVVGERKMKK